MIRLSFLSLWLVVTTGCTPRTSGSGSGSFPDIGTFTTTPSEQFILDTTGMSKVSRAFPYKGASAACAHPGGHLHFTNTGAPYTVDILAPAAGTISHLQPCYVLTGSDKYELSLRFATSGGNNVSFSFSVEPQDGYLCSGGVSGADNGFYSTYINVTEGQTVAKGDLLGRMYKSNSGDDAAHIHFNLSVSTRSGSACPNIFSSTITSQFSGLFNGETCAGTALPSTFCYLPDSGEDLTGL